MAKFTKVFLDSNVIFSALYSKQSTPAEVLYLGTELEIKLLISSQVELEVFRNLKLKTPGIVSEFQHLLIVGALTVVGDAPSPRSRKWTNFLSWGDASILESAIFF